ncbi:Hypothetical_protein [Hexamita inflata]|uniref:Hypothetical_protein n=1 Tax=Hexamita inflata TaxID=28002 RepID=A0ABP1L265_9EUKA
MLDSDTCQSNCSTNCLMTASTYYCQNSDGCGTACVSPFYYCNNNYVCKHILTDTTIIISFVIVLLVIIIINIVKIFCYQEVNVYSKKLEDTLINQQIKHIKQHKQYAKIDVSEIHEGVAKQFKWD